MRKVNKTQMNSTKIIEMCSFVATSISTSYLGGVLLT